MLGSGGTTKRNDDASLDLATCLALTACAIDEQIIRPNSVRAKPLNTGNLFRLENSIF